MNHPVGTAHRVFYIIVFFATMEPTLTLALTLIPTRTRCRSKCPLIDVVVMSLG